MLVLKRDSLGDEMADELRFLLGLSLAAGDGGASVFSLGVLISSKRRLLSSSRLVILSFAAAIVLLLYIQMTRVSAE